jgi:adenylate cyclase
MADYRTPEDEWHDFLSGTHPHLQEKSPLRLLPSSPRCKLCQAPFRGPGALILRRYGFAPWPKHPRICGRCFKELGVHSEMCPSAAQSDDVRGAEVELSMLFADVRGSSKLARQMSSIDFSRLMNRFYRESSDVLVEHDAIIEKFVGDEIVGLFVPFLAGRDHAGQAVEAARALFRVCGYGSPDGPWVPIGAGVHTGTAFVGMVGSQEARDFTALGDPMNVAAHLASQAAAGEILLTEPAAERVGLADTGLEHRHVLLKGHPIDTYVLVASPVATAAE